MSPKSDDWRSCGNAEKDARKLKTAKTMMLSNIVMRKVLTSKLLLHHYFTFYSQNLPQKNTAKGTKILFLSINKRKVFFSI